MSEASEAAVLFDADGDVGVITLNRGDNRNSMTPELLDAFAAAVQEARAATHLRALVITGRGRCFSAGADFKATLQRPGEGRHRLPHEQSFAMYEPFLSVLDIDVPVIGALNGHAVGGGFGLASVCDLRVCSEDAKYGANFARLGLHPGMAITYLLPRLVGVPRALELLLTGRLFRGREAAEMGWANRAVPADDVWPVALELARGIAANAPLAVRMLKRTFYDQLDWQPKRAAFAEAFAQAATVATRDVKEGMSALLDKRDPSFEGR